MAHAELSGDQILISTAWNEKEQIKLIPGTRWDKDLHCWTLPLTWVACLQLRGVFNTTLTVGEELTKWSWETFSQRVQPAMDLRNKLEYEYTEESLLYPFQAVGSDFMQLGNSLLSDELGLGKTITTLAALGQENGLPALVICPNSVKRGWEKAAVRWYSNANTYVISGAAVQRRKMLETAKNNPNALVIVNIEAVRLLSRLSSFGSIRLQRCIQCDPKLGNKDLTPAKCEVHPKELNAFGFKTVILDEAHRIKDPKSKQTRACWAVGHDESVKRRWALTGTPIANHVGDLWSLMHFVEPDEWATKSKFVDRYGLMSWNAYGGLDVVGINPAHKEEFYKILDPRFRRTLKALVLPQLPKKIRTTIWVEMSAKQERAYRELEKQLITMLDNGELLTVPNNLVKATRLLQLAGSYAEIEYVNGEIKVKLAEPSPKIDALEDKLDELGTKPVVIAAQSRQLIELVAARFKKNRPHENFGMITGGQDEWERQRAITQLQDGTSRAVLMTIQAGGTGVDGLQVADTMICLGRSWSMLENVQMEGRVDRIGSEVHDSIHMIDIITQGTIEESSLWPRLAEKFERLEEINRDRTKLAAAGQSTSECDLEESKILALNLGL